MTGDPITDGGGGGDRSADSRGFTYDLDDGELPSHAVVRAVAAITNESALDLEPLYDAIDPGRLDELFEGPHGSSVETELSFAFAGFDVTVTDEKIYLRESDDD